MHRPITSALLRAAPSIVVVLTAAGLLACQGGGAFASLSQNLGALSEGQADVLAKLDALDAKVDAIEIPPAAARKAKRGKPNRPDPTLTYNVPLGDAYTTGGDEPLVTIVAWSDFQCPYCARVVPTMAELHEAYGDDLRVAFKHNPLSFHKRAMAAAKAAEAAGKQGKFWDMHDKLFSNNKALTDDNFVAWAGELDLDVAQFEKDLQDQGLAEKITKQQAQGVKLGAMGTPAFFVNGRFISGAQPAAAFKKLIDEEKKKAEALIARGTPRAKIYETVVRRGKTKV